MALLHCSLQAFAPRHTSIRPSSSRSLRTIVHASSSTTPNQQKSRRDALTSLAAFTVAALSSPALSAKADEEEQERVFCNASCISELSNQPRVKTASGLEYQDISVGTGASPAIGYQVVAHYVAMTADGRIFSNSLERKEGPYDFRVGAGQVIPGLDEGILSMKSGGVRRLYIPGALAFPKGLPASPGRPRVPPNSDVIFDVQLLYVPGLDDE